MSLLQIILAFAAAVLGLGVLGVVVWLLYAVWLARVEAALARRKGLYREVVAGLAQRERSLLEPLQVIPTVPAGFTGKNTTAEIAVAPSGRFVYVSNRGHDSVAIFAVDATSGLLSPVGWEPARGKTPRFFALDPSGTFLYVANQNSDTIVAFRVDPSTGSLTPTGEVIRTGSPSSIVFR